MKITRRLFLLLAAIAAPLSLFPTALYSQKADGHPYLAYVGTYTEKTSSKGIYAYRYDATAGKLEPFGLAVESVNPSFLAIHPSGKYLYAVNEVGRYEGANSGAVSAFAVDHKTGKLLLLNEMASGGADPCYISLDKTGKYALVANYTGGSIVVFPILEDGKLGKASAFVQHEGHSVNMERQKGPHAHWIGTSPDNRYALVADLGLDEVLLYKFDATKGTLTPNDPPFTKLKPGTGPRHIAFSPNGKFVYVNGELNSTVSAFAYDAGRGELKDVQQQIPTLTEGIYNGKNNTAEIAVHPNSKFAYVSNRGADMLSLLALDPQNGTVTVNGNIQNFSTQGKEPRHFAIDPAGKYLLAENQHSDSVVVFAIDPATGKLTFTNQTVSLPSPVCLVLTPWL